MVLLHFTGLCVRLAEESKEEISELSVLRVRFDADLDAVKDTDRHALKLGQRPAVSTLAVLDDDPIPRVQKSLPLHSEILHCHLDSHLANTDHDALCLNFATHLEVQIAVQTDRSTTRPRRHPVLEVEAVYLLGEPVLSCQGLRQIRLLQGRLQEAVHQAVGVASDGRCEVRVVAHCQAEMGPLALALLIPRAEVLGLIHATSRQDTDDLVEESVVCVLTLVKGIREVLVGLPGEFVDPVALEECCQILHFILLRGLVLAQHAERFKGCADLPCRRLICKQHELLDQFVGLIGLVFEEIRWQLCLAIQLKFEFIARQLKCTLLDTPSTEYDCQLVQSLYRLGHLRRIALVVQALLRLPVGECPARPDDGLAEVVAHDIRVWRHLKDRRESKPVFTIGSQ
mmetsp:Transcript_96530/g.282145  ORF Transcript_96530/g.282145 Transcript_96530/m.282145 type:complete len:399 (+) Transcript_96530:47-1243(+)